jgi:hypothetical protein
MLFPRQPGRREPGVGRHRGAVIERHDGNVKRHPESLSDDEMATLAWLLRRYCTADLDQFDFWQVTTPSGPVYIEVGRRLPDHSHEFASLDPWAERHT